MDHPQSCFGRPPFCANKKREENGTPDIPNPKRPTAHKDSEGEKRQSKNARQANLGLQRLGLLLLLNLEKQRAIDVRENTTKGDGRTNQGVQFLVATDSELQVAGGDALDLQVLGGILK